jgi:hypothetical protein
MAGDPPPGFSPPHAPGRIVCSVAAIVVGLQAKKELDRHPELTGRRNARAGVALGVVGLAAWAVGVLVLSAIR